MVKLRDVVVFLAGAEFFHTLTHIFFYYSGSLPINMGFMILTSKVNLFSIIINAIITIILLWWASRLSR